MRTGRPREPSEAKILKGTFRPDRDPPPVQDGAGGVPEPPATLKDEALEFWKEVVPGLIERQVAKACDAHTLALMCEWWARYRRYSAALDSRPAGNGTCQLMMQVGLSSDKFDRLASRFGLNPSDRAKLKISPAKAPSKVDTRKRG